MTNSIDSSEIMNDYWDETLRSAVDDEMDQLIRQVAAMWVSKGENTFSLGKLFNKIRHAVDEHQISG